jgi:hypothetical protein
LPEVVTRKASFGETRLFIVTSRQEASFGEDLPALTPVTKVVGRTANEVTECDAVICVTDAAVLAEFTSEKFSWKSFLWPSSCDCRVRRRNKAKQL